VGVGGRSGWGVCAYGEGKASFLGGCWVLSLTGGEIRGGGRGGLVAAWRVMYGGGGGGGGVVRWRRGGWGGGG